MELRRPDQRNDRQPRGLVVRMRIATEERAPAGALPYRGDPGRVETEVFRQERRAMVHGQRGTLVEPHGYLAQAAPEADPVLDFGVQPLMGDHVDIAPVRANHDAAAPR